MTLAIIDAVMWFLFKHDAQAEKTRKENTMVTNAQVPPTKEEMVDDSIAEVAAVASSILSRFGHSNIAGAVQEYAGLAPVFASLSDTIIALFRHKETK